MFSLVDLWVPDLSSYRHLSSILALHLSSTQTKPPALRRGDCNGSCYSLCGEGLRSWRFLLCYFCCCSSVNFHKHFHFPYESKMSLGPQHPQLMVALLPSSWWHWVGHGSLNQGQVQGSYHCPRSSGPGGTPSFWSVDLNVSRLSKVADFKCGEQIMKSLWEPDVSKARWQLNSFYL
jgi:hypothetical protein